MVDGPYSTKSEPRPNDQMAELNTEIPQAMVIQSLSFRGTEIKGKEAFKKIAAAFESLTATNKATQENRVGSIS